MKTCIGAFALSAIIAGAAHAAAPIELRTEPGAFASAAEFRAHLRHSLRGAEAEIEFVDPVNGIVRLDGGPEAARVLRSDPAFVSVRYDGPAEPQERIYTVFLQNGQLTIGTVDSGRGEPLREEAAGWPGEFVRVVARDASGAVIAEGFVPDHRFVRYEAWNEDGSHEAGSNAAFVQDEQPLDLWVTLPAGTANIEVVAPANEWTGEGETSLGRADITLDGEE